jgi:hypothetical protein
MELARGYETATDVVNGWMNNLSDKSNILNPKFTDIGISIEQGTLTGEKNTIVIVQALGSRKQSVTNNNNQIQTNQIQQQTQQPASSTSNNNAPSYQNYGWYMHNGVSMQYVNGNWYISPQQGNPFLPQSNSTSNNSLNTQTSQQTSPNYVYVNCKAADGWTFSGYGTSVEEANQNCANNAQQNQTSQPSVNNSASQTVVNQPAPQNNNAQLNQQCQASAVSQFNAAKQQAMALYGGESSASQDVISIAQGQYNQAVANCNSQYPN